MKLRTRVNIRRMENIEEFLKIPVKLFSLTIPQGEGKERHLTMTEIHVLAFIMQFQERDFSYQSLSKKLSLGATTVMRALKALRNAGLVEQT